MSDVLPLIAVAAALLGLAAANVYTLVMLRRLRKQMRAPFARQRISLHPDFDAIITRERTPSMRRGKP